jgi:hypothetical protein
MSPVAEQHMTEALQALPAVCDTKVALCEWRGIDGI